MTDEHPGYPVSLAAGPGAGSRVAGYRLERQIGAGGMAVVYLARDERLGRPVALKVMAQAMAADETFRLRFIRESRAAAAVDDPHIIPVYEAGEADGVLFIAIRFVSGGDVGSLLRREGPLPAARVAAIISAVASALDAAHAAGLVHRDVKPANMLLDSRPGRPDHVYLSDFGSASRRPVGPRADHHDLPAHLRLVAAGAEGGVEGGLGRVEVEPAQEVIASAAPVSRSMPASSHSMEIGPE